MAMPGGPALGSARWTRPVVHLTTLRKALPIRLVMSSIDSSQGNVGSGPAVRQRSKRPHIRDAAVTLWQSTVTRREDPKMRSPLGRADLTLKARPALAHWHDEDQRHRHRIGPRAVDRRTRRISRNDTSFRSAPCHGPNAGPGGWIRCLVRPIVAVAVAGLTAVTMVVLAQATAAGSPCDGVDCVPHLRKDAVAGASCAAARVYPFGLDGSGNTLICYATYRNPITATWSPVPQLVGVRDYGALCSGGGAAQSPDGLPLVCRGPTWDRYTPDLPVG